MAKKYSKKKVYIEQTTGYRFDQENHIHILDGKPLYGCSTVMGVLDKPLTWWAAELAAVECLESGEHIPNIREEYLNAALSPNKKEAIDSLSKRYPIFKKARFAHFVAKGKKADQGTDMHTRLEEYVKSCLEADGQPIAYTGNDKQVKEFAEWAMKEVAVFLWSEAHCYNRDLWVGGITDAGATLMTGKRAIIDFKSSPTAYDSQFFQIGGYAQMIEHSGGLEPTGEKRFEPVEIDEHIVVAFGGESATIHYSPFPKDDRVCFAAAKQIHEVLNRRKQ